MKNKRSCFSKKNISLFLLLLLFWMVLSPKWRVEALGIGSIVSALLVFYSQDIVFQEREMPLYSFKKLKIFFVFLKTLSIEIIKANIEVVKIVLSPSLKIQPQFIRVPMMLENDVNKVIYSNAITLTPGTLTVDVREKEFIIHALTDSAAEGMSNSIIEEYVCKLEGHTQ